VVLDYFFLAHPACQICRPRTGSGRSRPWTVRRQSTRVLRTGLREWKSASYGKGWWQWNPGFAADRLRLPSLLVFIHIHRSHRGDAKNAEKFFIENI